jgi:hypothetical protein
MPYLHVSKPVIRFLIAACSSLPPQAELQRIPLLAATHHRRCRLEGGWEGSVDAEQLWCGTTVDKRWENLKDGAAAAGAMDGAARAGARTWPHHQAPPSGSSDALLSLLMQAAR